MRIGAGIDQLGTDTNSASGALHRTFEDVSDPKRFADFTKVALDEVFVLHHRSAADHFEIGHFRGISQYLVLNTVGKVGVLFVVAEIFKRKDSDAFSRNWAGCCCKYFTGRRAMAEIDRETDRERT